MSAFVTDDQTPSQIHSILLAQGHTVCAAVTAFSTTVSATKVLLQSPVLPSKHDHPHSVEKVTNTPLYTAFSPKPRTHSLTSNPRRLSVAGSTSRTSLPSILLLLTTNRLPGSMISTVGFPLSAMTLSLT